MPLDVTCLPTEIVARIFDLVSRSCRDPAARPPPRHGFDSEGMPYKLETSLPIGYGNRQLCDLALVLRPWAPIAQRQMWQDVSLRGEAAALSFLASPLLGKYRTRALKLGQMPGPGSRPLTVLTGRLAGEVISEVIGTRVLEIHDLMNVPNEILSHPNLSDLKRLRLDGFSLRDDIPQANPPLLSFTLTHLSLVASYRDSNRDVDSLLRLLEPPPISLTLAVLPNPNSSSIYAFLPNLARLAPTLKNLEMVPVPGSVPGDYLALSEFFAGLTSALRSLDSGTLPHELADIVIPKIELWTIRPWGVGKSETTQERVTALQQSTHLCHFAVAILENLTSCTKDPLHPLMSIPKVLRVHNTWQSNSEEDDGAGADDGVARLRGWVGLKAACARRGTFILYKEDLGTGESPSC